MKSQRPPAFLAQGGETGEMIRAHDWSTTPLGPPETWPLPLRTAVTLMLGAVQPVYIAWGPELVSLYNDDYLPMVGTKHPGIGLPYADLWAEIWDQFRPIVEKTLAGEAQHFVDLPIALAGRPDRPVGYFTFSYTALRGEDGAVAGFYCAATETTDKVLGDSALRDTEARRSLLIGSWAQAEWETDAHGVVTTDSPSWRAYTGQTVDECLGYGWLDAIHPDDRAYAERQWREAVAVRGLVNAEFRLRSPDGGWRWTNVRAAPVLDAKGALGKWAGMNIDIDARKRAEAALRESEELRRVAVESGRMGAWTWDTRSATIRSDAVVQALWGVATSEQPHSVALYADLMYPEGVAWLEAVAAKEKAPGQAIATQLQVATGPTSSRWVQLRGRAERDEPWIINGVTFDITEQKRAEQGLAESEARYAGLFEASPAPLLILKPDAPHFTITEVNKAYLAATMRMRDKVVGRGIFEAYPENPDDIASGGVSTLRTSLERVLATKQPDTLPDLKYDVARADGGFEERWWSPVNSPVFDENGEVEAIIHNANDVTDQHRAEAVLRDNEERQAFLLKLSDVLRPLQDAVQIQQAAIELLGEQLAVNRAGYYEVGADQDTFFLTAKWERGAPPLPQHMLISDFGDEIGNGYRAGRTMVARDTEQDAASELNLAAARELQIRSWIGVPLVKEGRWFAAMGVHSLSPRNWTPAEIRLVEEVAERTWAAIERARAEAALRDSEAQLRELNDSLESRVAERTAELEAAQDALRQSQKMEAMGSLTGGVAHDFNNLLTPIIGSLDMLVRKGIGSDRERRLIDGALRSAERAKVLVQRLLAFARRQPLQPVAVDVEQLVEGIIDLIASTLGPTIDVRTELAPNLRPAKTDPNQLEMALLNLAVNARDAMPDGGTLTIAAKFDRLGARNASSLQPGDYVRLCVIDTGTGMDEATLRRATEPFFSTKGVGKGTGLGLSMVHGLIAQLGGGLTVESIPGAGTTITLWLPISGTAVDAGERPHEPSPAPEVLGTALLVDDEELVRMSTADMLLDLGYEVVEAGSAEEALRLVDEGLKPDLLITDHLMPGMSGAQLALKFKVIEPGLPILIVSGYADVEGIDPALPRLTKPFRNIDLAASLATLTSTAST